MHKDAKKEWFENESFWIDMYPGTFPDSGFKDAARQTEARFRHRSPRSSL